MRLYTLTGIYRPIDTDLRPGPVDVGSMTRGKRLDIPKNAITQWFDTSLISRPLVPPDY